MAQLVRECRAAYQSLGQVKYGLSAGESTAGRRSLYVVKDIKAGEPFTEQNVRSIRPARGLKPKYYEKILGKHAKCDIKFGTPLSWELID